MRHPAVLMVAVVGVPDPVRTEIVKAFVVPKPGVDAVRGAGRRNPGLRPRRGWRPTSIRARSSS